MAICTAIPIPEHTKKTAIKLSMAVCFLKIQITKHPLFVNSSPHYFNFIPSNYSLHELLSFYNQNNRNMSRRRQLEHEVSVAQERIKKAAKDTPKDILKLWEQELVDLELELNNMVDDEEDNNED